MRIISTQKNYKTQVIQWGILGTGKIAYQFAEQLVKLKDVRLVGIASRKLENAQRFSQHYSGTKTYDNYEALCQDPEIDVIYVATPTHLHFQHCQLVLDANKALLCEKPFTRNYVEASEIIRKAQDKHLFCMEAMWMRFNPLIQETKQIIKADRLGKVCTFHAELGYQKTLDKLGTSSEGRGASLAFGCYGVSLALYLFGCPYKVSSQLTQSSNGGDETGAILLHYYDKAATIFYSEGATLSNQVTIFGNNGSLKIDSPFIDTTSITLINLNDISSRPLFEKIQTRASSYIEMFLIAFRIKKSALRRYRQSGFRAEAKEVAQCIRLGSLESKVMPLSETLMTHKILDKVLSTLEQSHSK